MITPWRYDYEAGPQPIAELDLRVEIGNCRRLVQRYLWFVNGIAVAPDDAWNPGLWRRTGRFVRRSRPMSLSGLPDGAVIFAERRMNRAGEPVDRGPDAFTDESGWAWHHHTAVWLSSFDPGAGWLSDEVPSVDAIPGRPAILHSTAFAETVVVWGIDEFERHYLPVAAKVVAETPVLRAPRSQRPGSPQQLRQAIGKDVMAIHALRRDLAEWLTAQGIEQWNPGDVPPWQVADQVDMGQWWVVDDPEGIAAAVRLLDTDPFIWPNGAEPGACYVHGLMVDRGHAGRGLGSAVLEWCARVAVARGADRLRLDCVATNDRLVDRYRGLGFRDRGERTLPLPWHPVRLLERDLDS
ncbi:GNAT family N-acetyltransferase [Microlunatus sp. Y2014]|uniref:GNAT family N-acetyltransferase n=1 Tax=Microlunatus sp. Y2014 TaxID=3418488 RepID=UPI003DA6FD50